MSKSVQTCIIRTGATASGALALLGLVRPQDDTIVLTDAGAYWLHALHDVFSIDYVSTLWGTSQQNSWPKTVAL